MLEDDLENYGIDDEGPTPDTQTRDNVSVPTINAHLSDLQIQILQSLYSHCEQDDDHGIEKYILVCGVISHLQHEREY